MKYIIFPLLVVFLSACQRYECPDIKDVTYVISDENKQWYPDSLYFIFMMVGSNGISESFVRGIHEQDTYNKNYYEDCITYNSHRSYWNYESNLLKHDFRIEVVANHNGNELQIDFDRIETSYNLEDYTMSIQHPSGDLSLNYLYLDSLRVDSILYQSIYKIDIFDDDNILSSTQPKTIYLSSHYGLIKYVQKDDVYWEMRDTI